MASKRLLDNLSEEKGLSKGIKLEQKRISVTISNKHPESDIDDHADFGLAARIIELETISL